MTLSRDELRRVIEGFPLPAALLADERILLVNAALAALFERPAAELEGQPFLEQIAQPDVELARERARQYRASEPTLSQHEVLLRTGRGELLPIRARVSLFPPAGDGALLFVCTEEPERRRSTDLLRGFVDVAAAAQGLDGELALLHGVRRQLGQLGLQVTLLERREAELRVLETDGPAAEALFGPAGTVVPIASWEESPFSREPTHLARDLPGVVALRTGRPRAELARELPPRAVVASLSLQGPPGYAIAISGHGLDEAVASGFGLLARQLTAALETARRMHELHRRNRELYAVNEVARASASAGTGRALHSALDQLVGALQVEGVALLRLEAGVLHLVGHQGFDAAWVAAARELPVDRATPWGAAVLGGEPVLFQLDPEGQVRAFGHRLPTPPGGIPRAAAASSGATCAALPLRVNDEVQGILLAARGGPLGRDELRLLTTVAAQVAVTLQNATLMGEMQRKMDELSLLLELGQEVVGALELEQVMQSAARVATRALRCSCAYVLLPNDDGSALRVAAQEDPEGTAVRAEFGLIPLHLSSMSALCFHTRRPQISQDTRTDDRVDPSLRHAFRCRATVAVPLLSHDRSLGVLLLFDRSERVFGPQDVRLASHAAQLVAAAIESAELYERERRRADEMALLQELSRATAGKLDLGELLDTALGRLIHLLGADAAAVWLPKEGVVQLAASRARDASVEGLPLERPVERGERLLSLEDSVRASTRVVRDSGTVRRVQRSLALPLFAGGALLLARADEHDFTPDEARLATAVCAQLSVALENARLYDDLRRSYSELARAQAELIDRERLAALGELSASVAHEVRNPLGVIFNSVGSLRRLLRPAGDVALLLDIVGEEADRLNRMVGDLLDYSRPVQPSVEPIPLAPLLEEALAAARQQATSDSVEARIDVAPEVATLPADARLLRQALLNLFLNSLQAMPRGGRLNVVGSRTLLEGRGAVQVLVRDTGPGIPRTARARIWQPFFTTKATGTGLGLAVVKRIVEGHGGRIELVDAEPGGAAFRIVLPLERTGA